MADLLCGTYYPSIDQKGRMSFPTKLREILGPEFYLCQGHDDSYIAVYSLEAFQEYSDKLYSIAGKKGADIRRGRFALNGKVAELINRSPISRDVSLSHSSSEITQVLQTRS